MIKRLLLALWWVACWLGTGLLMAYTVAASHGLPERLGDVVMGLMLGLLLGSIVFAMTTLGVRWVITGEDVL